MRSYILTEIWSAKPEWRNLPQQSRQDFFENKVGPFIQQMVEQGAQIIACAINDNDGPERSPHTYMAIWDLPDKAFSDRLEQGAKALGFLDYFEQTNFSGSIIPPPEMNAHMIKHS